MPKLITGKPPEKSDKVDKYEKQWDSSDRVLVLVADRPTNSFAFGRYRHNIHLRGWSIEGFNGDWRVIGWLPLPDVSEFEPKGDIDEL